MLKFDCMKIQEKDICIFPKTSMYRVQSARDRYIFAHEVGEAYISYIYFGFMVRFHIELF
jgi:hypothetical protein